jgi:HPt (histidine-containing phosphotransfer) domain-containing protein
MPAGGHQTFDREALLDRLDGDLRLARDLITTYLEESPAMRAGLRAALESSDPSNLERAAHTLRGALAAVSAPAASDLADRLETSSRDGDHSAGPARTAELEVELGLVEQALRSFLRETG